MNSSITEIIDRGVLNNEVKKGTNSDEYATSIVILLDGGILLGRVHSSKRKFDIAMERIINIINEEILL